MWLDVVRFQTTKQFLQAFHTLDIVTLSKEDSLYLFIHLICVIEHGAYAKHSSRCWGHSSDQKIQVPLSKCLYSSDGSQIDNLES